MKGCEGNVPFTNCNFYRRFRKRDIFHSKFWCIFTFSISGSCTSMVW
jgi:hypothetical protein